MESSIILYQYNVRSFRITLCNFLQCCEHCGDLFRSTKSSLFTEKIKEVNNLVAKIRVTKQSKTYAAIKEVNRNRLHQSKIGIKYYLNLETFTSYIWNTQNANRCKIGREVILTSFVYALSIKSLDCPWIYCSIRDARTANLNIVKNIEQSDLDLFIYLRISWLI